MIEKQFKIITNAIYKSVFICQNYAVHVLPNFFPLSSVILCSIIHSDKTKLHMRKNRLRMMFANVN